MKTNKQVVPGGIAAWGLTTLASLLLMAGCSVAPPYRVPDAAVTPAFKEAPKDWHAVVLKGGDGSTWKEAAPAEELARGAWWTVFGDRALDELVEQAMQANQELQVAAARVKESRAMTQAARAGLFPAVDLGAEASRQRPSAVSQGLAPGSQVAAQTVYRAQLGISYEVDLFGRVSSGVVAARAEGQRSEALFQSVRLALQADVAQGYFTLRQLDAEAEVFVAAVRLREEALQLAERRQKAGDIGALDVARARSELANARSDAMTVARLRAASEHALAVLLGKAPAAFSFTPKPLEAFSLRVPAGLPSSLLERRPDIAVAERAMAAANARIGVAKSAFFPSLTLTGGGGLESGSAGDLLQWSSRTFLLGPLLSLPLFDGGRREGQLAQTRAQYEGQVAQYRQQVLTAFREVEDGLADLRVLEEQVRTQSEGADAAAEAARLSRRQYAEGDVSYLEVIDAERAVLSSRRSSVQLAGLQAVTSVRLIRALGGGWGNQGNQGDNDGKDGKGDQGGPSWN